MSEMLGNQYFMARKYLEASKAFQKVLEEEPQNINARKRLVIAYSQIGKYDKSFELFLNLVNDDIDIIVNTNPLRDDCPCPELVNNLEKISATGNESFTTFKVLGVLWLFCDINKSREYFEKALQLNPNDEKLNTVLLNIKRKINSQQNTKSIQYPS